MAKPPPSYVLLEEADFIEVEWDAAKRETNWHVHEVDFEDVKEIFRRPHVVAPAFGYGVLTLSHPHLVMERTAGRLWAY